MIDPDIITTETLRFVRLLDAPIDKVWQYIVDPALRGRWFMPGPIDLRPGGSIGFTMNHDSLSDDDVPTPEKYRPHLGQSWEERIIRVEPPHLLVFTWESGNAGEVTFELADADGKTRLVLTHARLRGRDDAIDFGSGWQSHLAALEHRITGRPVADFWALHTEADAMIRRTIDAAA